MINDLIIPNFYFIILFKVLVTTPNAQIIQKTNNTLQAFVDARKSPMRFCCPSKNSSGYCPSLLHFIPNFWLVENSKDLLYILLYNSQMN